MRAGIFCIVLYRVKHDIKIVTVMHASQKMGQVEKVFL
ncbi:hypothetical protein AGRO_3464 [Agrobacterium sp. ATCC 31749]|nr:hypothetical protein AGRO_3464 [Agrobacterium sp. ATCC 31749]